MMPLIDYFYLDGHATNLVLFPLFGIGLFFLIRFIELADRGYLPYLNDVPCKKCRINQGLFMACKHDKYAILTPLMPSLYGFFIMVSFYYYIASYLKFLISAHPIPSQVYNLAGEKIKHSYGLQRLFNNLTGTENQAAYYANGTQVIYNVPPIETFIIDNINIILGVFR